MSPNEIRAGSSAAVELGKRAVARKRPELKIRIFTESAA